MLKENLREHLHRNYPETDLRQWFDPLVLRPVAEDSCHVLFPHPLFAAWVKKENLHLLREAFQNLHGSHSRLMWTETLRDEPVRPRSAEIQKTELKRTEHRDSVLKQLQQPGTSQSFETFLANGKNEFQVSLARQISQMTGIAGQSSSKREYNPLILCAPEGGGKTHLLRAMAASFKERAGSAKVFADSINRLLFRHEARVHGISAFLLNFEAVFLDDAQEIPLHPGLEQAMIHFLDQALEENRLVVLTVNDSLPQAGLSAKLRTRLEAGLVLTLKKPDLDIILRYTRQQAEARNLELEAEQVLYIAQNFSSFRLIGGILNNLSAYVQKKKRKLLRQDIQAVFENNIPRSGRNPSPEAVIRLVADFLDHSYTELLSAKRDQELVLARQISMFLCREILSMPYSAIGHIFGGKNHATVVYSCKKIKELQGSDSHMHKMVSTLRKKCLTLHGE